MRLYGYFRSSAAYRVRIALALKGLAYDQVPVHLLRGEQRQPEYLLKNPQGLVPTLELDDGTLLTQSLAIIEYLDALKPEPRLIPKEPLLAARVRAVALAIACDVHPLGNRRVLDYLDTELKQDSDEIEAWIRHWILAGLEAIEKLIASGPFCFGTSPTLADICLVPQIFNARRFSVPLEPFPRILAVDAACAELPAFRAAHPWQQADCASR